MKTYTNLYSKLTSKKNLYSAWRKARKGKTNKDYVKNFEENLIDNISLLKTELLLHSYRPKPLKNFIVRDPKTRKISKSDFRDRIVHHALVNVIEPIFEKVFIYDSYANRKGKGNLVALERLDYFKRKVSRNGKTKGWFDNNQVKGYCLKADIKHYFEEVNHKILLRVIKKKIKCNKTIWLVKQILNNNITKGNSKGMPLGNLTSQFFANVYLNELDYFVKHRLRAKYYVRYVDDFVILHPFRTQLIGWKEEINDFLKNELKIELHFDKSRIIPLSKPISFVGFRVFYYYKLLKRFNQKNIQRRLGKYCVLFSENKINYDKIYDSLQGSFAYMERANTHRLKKKLLKQVEDNFKGEISSVEVNKYLKYLNF
ncbi:MAG: reverse transcriptase/maturase family protein [Nanoarchaeota archaeon]|nr:reverse transcriptase/maturase family protein [Nanoarchaeota archaeon]MBU1445434.1 reverse transcriptase/maturase family protein [Nanoarchaeota archaeon]MBU2406966.1 reverse transcriptase/maturase family protein [Nanoarchaeota archaeon]MBU2420242.1 reverse transcriptase/maturase family protein [Nanoarchaeota archaeon]MBU2474995.1 reverse transcriptase/maturase family protein [Nanoarchaeota archaeon]